MIRERIRDVPGSPRLRRGLASATEVFPGSGVSARRAVFCSPIAWLTALAVGLVSLLSGCRGPKPPVSGALVAAAERRDALVLSDALEGLIAAGEDTPADREHAYEVVREHEEDTAAYAFARAAVTGRLVQQRRLRAAGLVREVERFARRSRRLDPDFRDGAATRMLGTLYVLAPASLLEHGDSEKGLELLETLAEERPGVLENRLRLAEAYVALGDPDPARVHLCYCLARKSALRPGDLVLLERLLVDAGHPRCDGR